jgi:hypothetical protein
MLGYYLPSCHMFHEPLNGAFDSELVVAWYDFHSTLSRMSYVITLENYNEGTDLVLSS